MPELRIWNWPERGARAEFDSLIYQAGRHILTPRPRNWPDVMEEVLKLYPKTWVPRGLEDFDFASPLEQVARLDVAGVIRRDVVFKSSPGVPLVALGRENSAVLAEHQTLVENAVFERIRLFLSASGVV